VTALEVVVGSHTIWVDATGSKSNQDAGSLGKVMGELVGALGSRETRAGLSRLAKWLAEVRAGDGAVRTPVYRRQRPRRPGWVLKAVVQVLADREEPMRAKDIHAAVEASVGGPVSWSSIKGALADHASGSSRQFVRIARGRYVLAWMSPRVRMRGLEPPPDCSDTDLNRARLPIPPHPRGGRSKISYRPSGGPAALPP
jgi:hypothetical protein